MSTVSSQPKPAYVYDQASDTYYPVGSLQDLSAYATTTDLSSGLAAKSDYAMPKNAQTGTAYTFALADGQKLVTASNAAASTYTVPPQSSVAWAADTILRITNLGAGVVTIAGGSGVTVTNTAATLAQYQSANLIRTASDAWTVVPFSGSSRAAYSAVTGSPSISTVNGKTVIVWTGAGSISISAAGSCRAFILGGGGGGGRYVGGGGGAGGYFEGDIYLSAATHPVMIGAGGAPSYNNTVQGSNGGYSQVGGWGLNWTSPGGGGGASYGADGGPTGQSGLQGGSGGGGSAFGGGASAISGFGNNGGNGNQFSAGGGGGAGAVGGTSTGPGAPGGAGASSSITGSSVTRGGGGGGGGAGSTAGGSGGSGGGGAGGAGGNTPDNGTNGSAGTANTGGGGGGGGRFSSAGGPGGSGLVVLVIG